MTTALTATAVTVLTANAVTVLTANAVCAGATPAAAHAAPRHWTYLTLLTWAFTFFNSVRVLAYLPTVVAIVRTGDASQHSLWTWATWIGANATMAAWLYEQGGRRPSRAVAVSVCNAAMCSAITALIVAHRL